MGEQHLISFFVAGHPQTQGSKIVVHRWGPMIGGRPTCRVGMREARGARLVEWRALIATAAAAAMDGRTKLSGPAEVNLTFFFERPTSHTRAQRSTRYVAAKSKDDVDKLARAVNDALTMAAVWEDDGQVAVIHAYKLYAGVGQRAGVRVEAMSL